MAILARKVVIGNRHVSRIASDVENLRVAMIKVLMALDHAGPGDPLHIAAGLRFCVGNQPLDVRETYPLAGTQKVCGPESRPGVAGTRIAHDEWIFRADADVWTGNVTSR